MRITDFVGKEFGVPISMFLKRRTPGMMPPFSLRCVGCIQKNLFPALPSRGCARGVRSPVESDGKHAKEENRQMLLEGRSAFSATRSGQKESESQCRTGGRPEGRKDPCQRKESPDFDF